MKHCTLLIGFFSLLLAAGHTTARFVSVDPVQTNTINGQSFSRYSYAENNPYKFVDPDGREVKIVGSDEFRKKVAASVESIKKGPGGRELIGRAESTPKVITITESATTRNSTATTKTADTTPSDSTVRFSPSSTTGGKDSTGSSDRPAFVGLAHELGHAVAAADGKQSLDAGIRKAGTTPPSEQQSMEAENAVRRDHGLPERPVYYAK